MSPFDALNLAVSALLGVLLLVSLWNALRASRLRVPAAPASAPAPTVTVLIPARNEALAVAGALRSLARHSPGTPVLVLDDESTDGTADTVRQLQRELTGEIALQAGQPLPAGWLGKNWACHQLAGSAAGEVLVFCDADVVLTGDAVAATVAALRRTGADVLTALPRQRYGGWWDGATIPLLLHFPLLGTLPLDLAARVRSPSAAYGNGQWLAFRRAAYERVGGHRAVRDEVVEDMALVRRAKALGLRVLPVLAPDLLAVRMYGNPRELFAGFAKNLYPLLGRSPAAVATALSLFLAVTALPFVLAARGAFLPLLLLAAVRGVQAVMTRASLGTVLLHPLGVVLACAATVNSLIVHHRGSVTWKARPIAPAGTPAPSR